MNTNKELPNKDERHKLFGSVEPGPRTKPVDKECMIDIQSETKDFLFSIDQVGISEVKHPITVSSSLNPTTQTTVGTFKLTADLAQDKKGTNMSRFLEQMTMYDDIGLKADTNTMLQFASDLKSRLKQENVFLELEFPWFYKRSGPDSSSPGMNHATVFMNLSYFDESNHLFEVGMDVYVTTLCPCSKEISEYSAHSQRGKISMKVTFNEQFNEVIDWKKDLLEAAEASGSAKIHPVLKRTDEKVVTETAYENPRFVEDVARLTASELYELDYVETFEVTVENEESIHLHNAIATIRFDKSR